MMLRQCGHSFVVVAAGLVGASQMIASHEDEHGERDIRKSMIAQSAASGRDGLLERNKPLGALPSRHAEDFKSSTGDYLNESVADLGFA